MQPPKWLRFSALKLHTKTTLLISLVLVSVFSVVSYFSNLAINNLTGEEESLQAQLLATRIADSVEQHIKLEKKRTQKNSRAGIEPISGEPFIPDWIDVKDAIDYNFIKTQKEIVGVHVYYRTQPGAWHEALKIPAEIQSLSESQKHFLLNPFGDSRIIAIQKEGQNHLITVEASIDVLEEQGPVQVGIVHVLLSFNEEQGVGALLRRILLPLLILAIVTVTLIVYFLFKYLVYTPLDNLLVAMSKAERGDLAIEVPVAAQDELGLLTSQFNRMAEQLNQEQHILEESIRSATAEIAERNEELEDANLHLFEMQLELTKLERLATAGQLAAQFAHEVGTPLNLISGHVQLLRTRTSDDRTIKRLDVIESQIDRVTGIVRSMLNSTKRPTPKFETTDINKILDTILDTTHPTLVARHVELQMELVPDLPLIKADADQLQQVFINLINNSLDAMPQGGKLTVSTKVDIAYIHLAISDTGKGIPQDQLDFIFEPLFSTKREQGGTGLGLTIVQQIILEHGGDIVAESEVGRGTTFLIKLPTAETFAHQSGGSRKAKIIV
jgi:two-component system, NtrC family, sensor kinase